MYAPLFVLGRLFLGFRLFGSEQLDTNQFVQLLATTHGYGQTEDSVLRSAETHKFGFLVLSLSLDQNSRERKKSREVFDVSKTSKTTSVAVFGTLDAP